MIEDVTATAIVAGPIALSVFTGVALLRRALARTVLLPEEVALAAAWVFVVGSLVWLRAFLSGSTLLGFGAPLTWLAASHFAAAGFGALTITALTCRVVSDARALKVLRVLLVAHPAAYLVTAAGISGFRYCDELGATGYELIFVTQLAAYVVGRPARLGLGQPHLRSSRDGALPRSGECARPRRLRVGSFRLGAPACSCRYARRRSRSA
jgi:hypothetical protein